MTVREFIKILRQLNPKAKVQIRYETYVVYSELTTGEEDRIGLLLEDAVLNNEDEDTIILAADLCNCK